MSAASASSPPEEGRFARVLVVVGIVALAFNLRPSAVSVGPVLDEIIDGLGMSAAEAGVLTSLPVLAFAVFGALAPRLARLVGVHRLTTLALVGVVVGLYLRSRADEVWAFLAFSLLSLAGMATANVLLPSLVKLHFPDRIGLMTSIYSTALAIGLTSASVFTVPISEAYDGWRSGLAAWALLAAVAVVPWLGLFRHDRPADLETSEGRIGLGEVARTRLGWLMALFFGLQSLQAYSIFGWFAEVYRDAGFSAHTAGLLLGVITGISIPLSFVIPNLAARMDNQAPLMWALMACYPIGYLGLILAPRAGRMGVGTRGRGRHLHVPADPDVDRAAGAHRRRHRCALRVHPVDGLPDLGGRAVRRRAAARPHRRLDGAADRADRRLGAAADARTRRVAPVVPGGRAAHPWRHGAGGQTTLSGSSRWPVGPIWMSVPISGQTPQS